MSNELITINNGNAFLSTEISSQIADFEKQVKLIKEKEEALKSAILNEMENKCISKLESEEITISYIAPTDRETFDIKAFKTDFEELYNDYTKISKVKSSIRIKVK